VTAFLTMNANADEIANAIRVKHYSIRTEEAYVGRMRPPVPY